jgi:cell division protein FtsB
MQAAKYLFAVWAGVLIYVTLTVFFGAKGVYAQYQLEKEYKKQEENIGNLGLINRKLKDFVNFLMSDEDTLLVYVREQGYASPRERFVRIVGLGINQQNITNPGTVVIAAEPQYTPNWLFGLISFCAGLTILIPAAIFDLLKYLREK